MDLYELEKEKNLLESRIQSKKERIELERSKLEASAIDYSKVSVQSSHKNDSMMNAIIRISEIEKDIVILEQELKQNARDLDRLYNILRKFNDRDQQIYYEKRVLGWSNAKISTRHYGISKRYINKIIQKIYKNLK